MDIQVVKNVKVSAKILCVRAGARYREDADVNGKRDEEGDLMPFFEGEYWCPQIDIDTGVIVNWPEGMTANIHYKVCDDGTYTVKDADGNIVIEKDGYVPDIMCPEGEGFGDYIIMKVDGAGKIAKWNPDFKDFKND